MSELLIALCLIALVTIAFVGLSSFALLLAFFGPPAAFAFAVAVQLSRWGCDLATSTASGWRDMRSLRQPISAQFRWRQTPKRPRLNAERVARELMCAAQTVSATFASSHKRFSSSLRLELSMAWAKLCVGLRRLKNASTPRSMCTGAPRTAP